MAELAETTWQHMAYQLTRGYRAPDERGFTDHHLVELSLRHDPDVQAKLFTNSDEAATGADFELWFGSYPRFVGALVQAKKLDRSLDYAGLNRTIGNKAGAPRQIDQLIDACTVGTNGSTRFVGYEPLYLFYNGPPAGLPADRCKHPSRSKEQRGCTIARASDVRDVLDAAPGAPHESASDVAVLAWPWQCLICCPALDHTLSFAERTASFLAGAASPATDQWVPAAGAGGSEYPRIWEWDELPYYVNLMANNDAPGDVDIGDAEIPGAPRVVLIKKA